MKRNFLLLLLVLCSPPNILLAQDTLQGPSLVAGYDDVSAGRNLSITYHQPLGHKWEVYGGIKYFLNSRNYKNVHSVATPFFKELYADKLTQRAGFKLGLQRQLWQPNKQFSLFAFYELQRSRGNVSDESEIRINDSVFFENNVTTTITAWENSIGLTANVRINERFSFRTQAGIGLNLFWENSNANWLSLNSNLYSAFTRMFSFAMCYKLYTENTPQPDALRPLPYKQALSLSFDNIQTGRTLNLTYRRALNEHHSVYGGIKVQINSHLFDDHTRMGESYYFKQFRAEGFGQHLGLKAGYEYGFAVPRSNLYLFGFYDLQLSRAVVRNLVQLVEYGSGTRRSSSPMGYQGYIFYRDPSTVDHQPSYRYYGPVTALENYMGLGAKMGITSQLQLRIQAGIGYNFYSGPGYYDPYYVLYQTTFKYVEKARFDAPKSELSKMFSLGLDYAIGR